MFKDQHIREKFMKNKKAMSKHNLPHSSSGHDELYDKIQNPVPAFETNQSKRVIENVETHDGNRQIIQIDGKRYLVIQELDPSEEVNEDDYSPHSQ